MSGLSKERDTSCCLLATLVTFYANIYCLPLSTHSDRNLRGCVCAQLNSQEESRVSRFARSQSLPAKTIFLYTMNKLREDCARHST